MIIQLNALVSVKMPGPKPGIDLHLERYAMHLAGLSTTCKTREEALAVGDEIDRVDAIFDAREGDA